MSKWKFFNFRPLFFVFTMLVVGILSANYFRSKLYLAVCIIALTVLILLFYCIKFKKSIFLLVGLIAIAVGIGDFYIEKNKTEKYNINFSGNVVCGTIESAKKSYSGRTLVITDVTVNDEEVDTNCEVRLIANEVLDDFNAGDKVTFIAEVAEFIDLYGEEVPSASYIKKNIKYKLTTYDVIKYGKDKSLKVILQEKIKENLALGLDNDKTNLMYSALLGDKTELNPMIKDSFSDSGVAHLLAVSGLHVGIIVGVLMGILKLLKCNKYAKFIIILLFLIFYCYLCGWSASIVRATIMTIILLGAPLLLSEYDTLSSISLAGIIILLITPSALFDISFLLSFMCVLGITMFYPYATKVLNKIHFNNSVTQIFAISVIVNVSATFVILYFFKMDNYMGIFANIFILPLFTFVFSVVFVVALISLFAPFVCYLLNILAPLINLVVVLSNYFASISTSLIATNLSFLSVILFAVLLFFLSKFNIKGVVGKSLSINVILIILILQILLNAKVIGL